MHYIENQNIIAILRNDYISLHLLETFFLCYFLISHDANKKIEIYNLLFFILLSDKNTKLSDSCL